MQLLVEQIMDMHDIESRSIIVIIMVRVFSGDGVGGGY